MKQTAVVVGVGAQLGLGAAVCRKFAKEGFHVFVGGRTLQKLEDVVAEIVDAGGSAQAVLVDATQEADITKLFDLAMKPSAGLAPASVAVFNAGDNAMSPIAEMTPERFEKFWRIGCLAGFLVAREVATRFAPLGRGTAIFTGASGSLRGKAGFGHFAAAKAGLRMVAQSLAREIGPQGVHVAHVVIDGGIDGDRLHKALPGVAAIRGQDGLLNVEAIAESYWYLHSQHPSAWTQELDLRPFKETF